MGNLGSVPQINYHNTNSQKKNNHTNTLRTAVLSLNKVHEGRRNRWNFRVQNTFQHTDNLAHRWPVALLVLDAPAGNSAGHIELLDVGIPSQPVIEQAQHVPLLQLGSRVEREIPVAPGSQPHGAPPPGDYLEEHDAEAVNICLPGDPLP